MISRKSLDVEHKPVFSTVSNITVMAFASLESIGEIESIAQTSTVVSSSSILLSIVVREMIASENNFIQ